MLRGVKAVSWVVPLITVATAIVLIGSEAASQTAEAPGLRSLAPDSARGESKPLQPAAVPYGQSVHGEKGLVLIPVVPFITEYEHGKQYYVEKINDHPVFIGIEAIVQEGTPPICQVIMTEKAEHRKRYYTNSESKGKLLSASGKTVFVTAIEHKVQESLGEQPKHTIAFKDERGIPIKWTFTQVNEMDDDSKGVALIGRPFKLLFREMACMAGEGTLVEIGDKVSQPKQLPHLSAPPDLLAYEGTLCVSTTIGGIVSGSEDWQCDTPGRSIQAGMEWVLTDAGKNRRRFKVTSGQGTEFRIQEAGADPSLSPPVIMIVMKTSEGLSLSSFGYADGAEALRFSFAPALDIPRVLHSGQKSTVSFQIDIGAAAGAVRGDIDAEPSGQAVRVTLRPTSPEWAKNIVLKSEIIPTTNGYRIVSEKL